MPALTTVRIWFTKTGEASYISLLDLQRVMQRALKRSGLPVWYTLGFNPHIYMTFACPLPLGQESLVESVDVKTETEAPDLVKPGGRPWRRPCPWGWRWSGWLPAQSRRDRLCALCGASAGPKRRGAGTIQRAGKRCGA